MHRCWSEALATVKKATHASQHITEWDIEAGSSWGKQQMQNEVPGSGHFRSPQLVHCCQLLTPVQQTLHIGAL